MSQVTAPILLDSTGQDISAKLQAIANAINGGTIDPLTVTQDGVYTPSGTTLGYGPVTVNVGGGGGITILSGTDAPTAAQGNNGQIYLQYNDTPTPTLPTGYTLLESIILTGTQYINTGIPGNTADLTVDLVYKPTSGYTQEAIVFGADWSTTGYFLMLYSGKWRFHSKGGVVDDGTADLVNYTTIRTTPSLLTVNGTDYTVSGGSANSSNNLVLGYSTYLSGKYGRGTLKSMSMWSGSTPLREFWPVLDDNSVPCLYDAVSGTTFYNAGSGTFGYNSGGVVNEITQAFAKVSGAWLPLIGASLNDINLGS